ncbi:MAG: hypothetical protein M1823_001271 [Watsoniomyces obsoletus]|nr:MAG: hypothetical protein M1823_001271 [Watsoniomyces obsoletus]
MTMDIPSTAKTPEWNESSLTEALRQLDIVHLQLRDLRSTIPKMLSPSKKHHASAEEIYQHYARSIKQAMSDVKSFTACMQSENTQLIFDQVDKSRKEKPRGIRPWIPSEHPDWAFPHQASRLPNGGRTSADQNQPIEDEEDVDSDAATTLYDEEGLKKLLDEWRQQHPGGRTKMIDPFKSRFDVWTSRASYLLTYLSRYLMNEHQVILPTSNYRFQIEKETDDDGKIIYTAYCTGRSKLKEGINDCIDERKRPGDLRYLLEMIASYDDVTSRECDICGEVLGKYPLFPTIRKKIRGKDKGEMKWEARHIDCP